jgi:hypothetical protein
MLIPNRFRDEANWLVFFAAGFVPRQSKSAGAMLLPEASPSAKIPAPFRLILKAIWN